MPALVIPESGVTLGSSRPSTTSDSAVPNVFGISLRDGVIEEMIKCFNSGKTLQLSLGKLPTLQYGSKTQHLSTSTDPFPHELFRSHSSNSQADSSPPTTPAMKANEITHHKSTIRVETAPHPQFLAMFAPTRFAVTKKGASIAGRSNMTSKPRLAGSTGAVDAAVAALQNSLASENAKKAENTTKYIKDGAGLPPPVQAGPSGKTAGKSKFLSQNRALVGDVTRSMPPSPALSGAGSPSLGPTSVPLSQQQLAQARATRKPVVHLLALGPITEVALRDKIPAASNSDLKQALQKVGDLNQSTGKWELRKPFYKELDVWTYDYDTSAERQRAIDNAIKRYDQMRLGVSDAEWDRLLPQVERGTGKCLSKLQAQIAQATAARPPKINVQKPEVSTRDTSNEEDEDISIDKNPGSAKGESRARSVSHSLPTKVKKASEKVVTTKRWISKKAPKQKPSPAKRDRPGTKQGKFLSSQFVSESDSDEEDLAPSNAGPNPMKRSREDEEETSDSSIPLSKKVKENHAHRVSDSSQSSRAISTSSPSQNRAKGNSPQKSSPLATSPPTNASEFESSSGRISSSASPAHHNTKGRRSPIYKRHQKSSSVTSSVSSSSSHRSLNPDVVDLARRYRSFYPKYEALHREVANSGARRNIEREHELLDMHERLSDLKKQILTGIVYVEN